MKTIFNILAILALVGCAGTNTTTNNTKKQKNTVPMSETEKRIYADCLKFGKPANKYESYNPDTKLCECTTKLFLSKATPEETKRALSGDWWEWNEAHNVCFNKLYTVAPIPTPIEVYISDY